MFVHTGENLPQDPRYAADLAKLGYKVDENKQIVSMERAHHFIYFHTSSDRANEKRKEAMHHCARGLVKQELAELGVVEVFLGGEKGREILGVGPKEKPKVKHLPILISEPENLRKKRDVIVVIGEPSENIGIWAWRHLLTSGGIEGGSAVGLVKKLIALGMDSTGVDFKGEGEKRKEMGQKASVNPASRPIHSDLYHRIQLPYRPLRPDRSQALTQQRVASQQQKKRPRYQELSYSTQERCSGPTQRRKP